MVLLLAMKKLTTIALSFALFAAGVFVYMPRETLAAFVSQVACSQMPALSGNVTTPGDSCVTTLAEIATNVTMALGEDATGDIYYRNSSGYLARLGIGANNYVVTSNGTTPGWGPNVGGGMTYLCTITASGSGSINNASPTSGSCPLNSTYTSYELIFQNIIPATDEKILELQIHSGGSYKSSSYLTNWLGYINGSGVNGDPTGYVPLSYPSDTNAASLHSSAPGYNGTVIITNPSVSGLIFVNAQFGYISGGGAVLTGFSSGFWNSAAAVDGFQVLMDSGNITSGSILVYGVQ
jgi:hypothetical protein